MQRGFLCLIVLVFSGCRNYFPPSPTSRAASRADLAGEWRYQPPASGQASVVLILKADSTFTQRVQIAGKTLSQSGVWAIDGTEVVLTDALTEFNGWRASPQRWVVIDRHESPAGFAILGGADDPDQWIVFDWVR